MWRAPGDWAPAQVLRYEGQRSRNNNFTIEGVDNNSKVVTGPLAIVPNDAVASFSLLQNQFSAEFGHSSGGQFNTVVQSGSNNFPEKFMNISRTEI